MKVFAVIGANFGDEGKGLLVDYFASKAPSLVVRFNGGAQAGHTVVTPEGRRHVFSHIGSGYYSGAHTYLSQFFLVNPLAWVKECAELGGLTTMYAHYRAPLTTPYDVLLNQLSAETRQHGTCGMGISETVIRCRNPRYYSDVSYLYTKAAMSGLMDRLAEEYVVQRAKELQIPEEILQEHLLRIATRVEEYLEACAAFADQTEVVTGIHDCMYPDQVVFEGAQGLELCETNLSMSPHITHTTTGVGNVVKLLREIRPEISALEIVYASRTYLTRHGNGPLPGEDSKLSYEDNTNHFNQWQGRLRFAPLDIPAMHDRILRDWWVNNVRGEFGIRPSIAFTHVDQAPVPIKWAGVYGTYQSLYTSDGPTRDHVRKEW